LGQPNPETIPVDLEWIQHRFRVRVQAGVELCEKTNLQSQDELLALEILKIIR
jgi:hypothetical protein